MSLTQFAMVEELAFLVKDNLPCKHLVLSMEEALINFLEDTNSSSDSALELEPMNPYNRLLLHRLADIFGFAHCSVGEGDNRHLILERSPETSVPSILVRDILFECEEHDSPASHHLLRRKDAPMVSRSNPSSSYLIEEREAAYLVARDRIFSVDEGEMRETVEQRPRSVPVVARRMIAHALGKRMNSLRKDDTGDGKGDDMPINELNTEDKDKIDDNSSLEAFQGTICLPAKNDNDSGKPNSYPKTGSISLGQTGSISLGQKHPTQKPGANCNQINVAQNRTSRSGTDHLKREHVGAAKRMFTHALGLQPARSGSLTRQ
uniref:R3H domain-containing protein 1-like n=3 Tax=Rhizophora mucronata TaxID=61149 RepID=A0A2P2KSQ1_RHIMU